MSEYAKTDYLGEIKPLFKFDRKLWKLWNTTTGFQRKGSLQTLFVFASVNWVYFVMHGFTAILVNPTLPVMFVSETGQASYRYLLCFTESWFGHSLISKLSRVWNFCKTIPYIFSSTSDDSYHINFCSINRVRCGLWSADILPWL